MLIKVIFKTFFLTDYSMVILDKSGLKISFKLEKQQDNADLLVISVLAQNSGLSQLTDFLFQAAVPKVGKFAVKEFFF